MLIMFFIYFRSKRGMFLPIVAAGVSAIWGLGFLSLLGFNLDPLVLVFPFLISAMAASHSVQVVKRYKEEALRLGDNKAACKAVIEHLFVPGFAGIITDASGIIIIALVPIPILQKICLSCSFWAFATIIIAMILIPIMISYMPIKSAAEGSGILDKLLKAIGHWICSWGKYPVIIMSTILLVWGSFYSNDIQIGSALPGSEVLWPWHRYNVDSFRVTFGMPLLNPLLVIMQGEEAQSIGLNTVAMRDAVEFGRYMQRTPGGPTGPRVMFVLSCLGQIPGRNRGMRDNDPNQEFLPKVDSELRMLYKHIVFASSPGSMDKFIDNDEKTLNIIIYCRDKTTETIQIVMDRIHDYIRNKSPFGKRSTDVKRVGFDKFVYWIDGFFREQREPIPEKPPVEGMPAVHYRLAGGAVGVQAGINEALQLYQIWTFILAILTVLILCAIIFKSFFAGIIITAPLIVANVLTFTFLAFSKPALALTTATLPVSAVGIGLGVDYGIYLVSRILEEYDLHGNLDEAICISLGTTGKAIVYVATTLVCGIVFWFISKMMFQAMMGLLLAIILLLNMLGALLIIPAAVSIVKPKFIVGRKK
jgi:predicted RND superfamily exporter protein